MPEAQLVTLTAEQFSHVQFALSGILNFLALIAGLQVFR